MTHEPVGWPHAELITTSQSDRLRLKTITMPLDLTVLLRSFTKSLSQLIASLTANDGLRTDLEQLGRPVRVFDGGAEHQPAACALFLVARRLLRKTVLHVDIALFQNSNAVASTIKLRKLYQM